MKCEQNNFRRFFFPSQYVALSRLRTIEGLFFKSKAFDRFQKINESVMLRLRKYGENDL